ncbi:MAG: flavodoxin family protein [Parvularculaceae bacterium]|nr:flavodoxin family protein [Parvularculaceae bacterium]
MMEDDDARAVFYFASSRSDGDTQRLARAVCDRIGAAAFVDLGGYRIGPYDYAHANADDDFLALAFRMTRAGAIVFASPVYWYAMSAQMKLFFDRLTDLTETRKAWGKSLAGKSMFVIASGQSRAPDPSFEPPFSQTAAYFGMNYAGMLYGANGAAGPARIAEFAARIEKAAR